ncbi:MAG: hypothetical protein LUH22_09295 [Bacteroides sp.]|nr:hypothetical protein [Bacteroides sp.]
MKTLIKLVVTLFCLSLVGALALYILSFWGIHLLAWSLVGKIILTAGVISVTTTIYAMIVSAIIRKDRYRKNDNVKVYPMR